MARHCTWTAKVLHAFSIFHHLFGQAAWHWDHFKTLSSSVLSRTWALVLNQIDRRKRSAAASRIEVPGIPRPTWFLSTTHDDNDWQWKKPAVELKCCWHRYGTAKNINEQHQPWCHHCQIQGGSQPHAHQYPGKLNVDYVFHSLYLSRYKMPKLRWIKTFWAADVCILCPFASLPFMPFDAILCPKVRRNSSSELHLPGFCKEELDFILGAASVSL